ncbi:hypothetical protein BC938DRAFT_471458 [Jimgerdemannia flammicorona]|uniref:Uncharacterized protein n=1 Tax=Jimgerdemannia flammicorona TaxID=994334 RepID=A0A433Q827_9FUNG|nr:hypothetical protein BC938DRAFT_471458 [Jimgerdemannia flammicorona]
MITAGSDTQTTPTPHHQDQPTRIPTQPSDPTQSTNIQQNPSVATPPTFIANGSNTANTLYGDHSPSSSNVTTGQPSETASQPVTLLPRQHPNKARDYKAIYDPELDRDRNKKSSTVIYRFNGETKPGVGIPPQP